MAVGPVTTDHIAPAGSIVIKNPPAQYLMDFLRYHLPRSADVGGSSGEWRSPCEAWWIPWKSRSWDLVRMLRPTRQYTRYALSTTNTRALRGMTHLLDARGIPVFARMDDV